MIERVVYRPLDRVLHPKETVKDIFMKAVSFIHGDPKTKVVSIKDLRDRKNLAEVPDSITKHIPPRGF